MYLSTNTSYKAIMSNFSNQFNNEQIIKNQNKQLEAIIDNIGGCLAVIDKYGKFIILNDEIKRVINIVHSPGAVIEEAGDTIKKGQRYFDNKGNELKFEDMPSYKVFHGEYVHNQHIVVQNDKEEHHYSFSATPIYDDNGEFLYGIITGYDITEIVMKDSEIRKRKVLLDTVIENLNDAIGIYDHEGKLKIINSEARRLYPELNIQSSIENSHEYFKCFDLNHNVIPVENFPAARVIKGERIKDEKLIVKYLEQTKVMEINAIPLFDTNHKINSAVVIHHDITQIVENEKNLKQQKELLELVVDYSYENFFVINSKKEFIVKKSKFKNILFPEEAYRFYIYNDKNGKRISLDSLMDKVLKGNKIKDEIYYFNIKGKNFYFIINGVPIYDENGNFKYGVFTSKNITELLKSQKVLKDMQNELYKIEQEKNRVLTDAIQQKDEFLSLISHEFKTPLTIINSAIQTLELVCENEISPKMKGYINKIRQNSYRQIRLVNNLLDITKINSGYIRVNKKNIDIVFLTKSIIESVQPYANRKGIDLTFTTSFKYKKIGIDFEKYERIILNLLSNAIKFTPEGRSVKTSLSTKKVFSV